MDSIPEKRSIYTDSFSQGYIPHAEGEESVREFPTLDQEIRHPKIAASVSFKGREQSSLPELKHPNPSNLQRICGVFSRQARERNVLRSLISGGPARLVGKGEFKETYEVGISAVSLMEAKHPMAKREIVNYQLARSLGLGSLVLMKGILKAKVAGGAKTAFFVTEYCPGGTFEHFLLISNIIETHTICTKIAQGLAELHQSGMVHHDIKPDNILLTKDREPKINDFGLMSRIGANRSESKFFIFTSPPDFFNKENGETVWGDPKFDVYQLGLLLYLSYTSRNRIGDLPWIEGESDLSEITNRIINPEKPPEKWIEDDFRFQKLPGDLKNLILKMVKSEAKDRPTMEAVVQGLKNISGEDILEAITQDTPKKMEQAEVWEARVDVVIKPGAYAD